MGNALIITGRSLGLIGRGLVTDAGGAPCCCGGVSPCGCVANPGCEQVQTTAYHLTKNSIAANAPQYSYGPASVPCCCKPSAPKQRSYEFHGVDFNEAGCVSLKTDWSGSGTGIVPIHVVCREASSVCGPLRIRSETDIQFGDGQCFPTFPYPMDACSDGGLFGWGNGVRGWERRTCSVYEGHQEVWLPRSTGTGLFLGIVRDWRFTFGHPERGCITETCKTCCLPDETCILADPAACVAAGGVPGTGDDCTTADCPGARPRGACCKPDGTCQNTSRYQCDQFQGTYNGDGSDCASTVCPGPPIRSCCLPAGGCIEATQAACGLQGGIWSPTLHCIDNPCPQPGLGACCQGSLCTQQTESQCATNGGLWRGLIPCSPGLCDCEGACCSLSAHGGQLVCSTATQAACLLLNQARWYGCGVTCEQTNNCTAPIGIILPPRPTIVIAGCAGCREKVTPWA